MPNYTFYNKELEEETIISMPMAELDSFLLNNSHLQQVMTATALADPTRLGMKKPDNGFRDVLKRVKKASGRNNTVNTW
jgi:hypothetical protein